MDRLRCLEIFAEVARRGSFTAAAQQFRLSRSAVTKHVAWLEHSLGVALLERTTKHVGLTDAGHRVLSTCLPLLERYGAFEAEVRGGASPPRGTLRVGTPPSFGARHLLPAAVRFAADHPDIEVALEVDDGRAPGTLERVDVSVRLASALPDERFIEQPLFTAPQVLVASPAYLRRRGKPVSLHELAAHECLVNTSKSPTNVWRFLHCDAEVAVRVRGMLCSNLGDTLRHAALLGLGLSIHPCYVVQGDIEAGRLVAVLPDSPPVGLDLCIVRPARAGVPSRVRSFIEFLERWASTSLAGSAHPAAAPNA